MDTGLALAYGGYLAWLLAGLADFLLHWRTDLRHTSGLAESTAHLVQLVLLGGAIVLGLSFAPGPALAAVLAMLVLAHAGVGYLDSRIAFRRRRTLYPAEQHVHSILDMAPLISLGLWLWWTWPAAIAPWAAPALREPPLPATSWGWVLAPAALLCVLPALLEFRAAWTSRFTTRG